MTMAFNDFIHPSDKKALEALKAIPGFDLVLKKFMSIVGERLFQIQSTSSYLKLGPNQLPEIYNILVKVCKRLEIEVPELYLALDRNPNACTYGDTDVFIVINSGLIETMTIDQIETVIAHECGHIVCHHVLYHTMGRYILDGADIFANGLISTAVVVSMKYAFAYWMRCSEFSADRVAAYYHQSSDPVVEVMMALAGGTYNLQYKLNRDEFFKQAQNYKILIDNSSYNKVIEFIEFGLNDHPLNAYRAYEINEFYKKYAIKYLPDAEVLSEDDLSKEGYILRIRYEYTKPKSLKKITKIFDNNKLEITINGEKYTVGKNDEKDISLERGKYTVGISNGAKNITYAFDLKYDANIVVSWDGETEVLSATEEL